VDVVVGTVADVVVVAGVAVVLRAVVVGAVLGPAVVAAYRDVVGASVVVSNVADVAVACVATLAGELFPVSSTALSSVPVLMAPSPRRPTRVAPMSKGHRVADRVQNDRGGPVVAT
jgi:hypothetical protein